ncbi:hypothetical protein CIG75_04400 [Tumebacillus algifaecis]|uniref:Uncharacterized protein n=1 Tax=Tumebacillus algifaecis TaxID=1214604 RepID=A0A223CY28_9BACL|nr:hypothetical protein [Tumebacillus algifaecis]ASS74300.1 hypothetical protein CIG75_04400 [Tumebacillus algifaecis]
MFDPTIYDNLKVVFEGALYDLDREGRILVSGREDLVNLATMARTFVMKVEKPEHATCIGKLELTSTLVDFASELRLMRLADEVPGVLLTMSFEMPERMVVQSPALDDHFQAVWAEVAEVVHERLAPFEPQPEKRKHMEEPDGIYRITLSFRGKIDEDNIEDVVPLLEHFVSSLETIEDIGNSL